LMLATRIAAAACPAMGFVNVIANSTSAALRRLLRLRTSILKSDGAIRQKAASSLRMRATTPGVYSSSAPNIFSRRAAAGRRSTGKSVESAPLHITTLLDSISLYAGTLRQCAAYPVVWSATGTPVGECVGGGLGLQPKANTHPNGHAYTTVSGNDLRVGSSVGPRVGREVGLHIGHKPIHIGHKPNGYEHGRRNGNEVG
jgi:hypothetical protein